jgi:type IV secretion system protein VirD4
MVSRSETARQLLTPGEVMQLPSTDEVVMVAGVHPIRAKKARYFADPRFAERVLPAPAARSGETVPRPDDWTALKPPLRVEIEAPAQPSAGAKAVDTANANIRREPDLPEHEEVVREPVQHQTEFVFDDADTAGAETAVQRQMLRVAGQASLDPGDGLQI